MARVCRIRLSRLKKGFLVLLFPLSTAVQKQLLDSRSYSIGPGTKSFLLHVGPTWATQLMLKDPNGHAYTFDTASGPQAASPAFSPAPKGQRPLET